MLNQIETSFKQQPLIVEIHIWYERRKNLKVLLIWITPKTMNQFADE
jgi:hypothetical protein